MTSVSQLLPNFIQGINEQPDELKKPGQVRDAVNVYPDVTKGLMKRTGYELIKDITEDDDYEGGPNGTWFSFVRRDGDVQKRYIFNVGRGGEIRGWDADTGDAQIIKRAKGKIDLGLGDKAFDDVELDDEIKIGYLESNSDYAIKTAGLADSVFLCNSDPEATVSMTSSKETERPYEAYIEVKVLDVTRSYSLNYDKVGTDENAKRLVTKIEVDGYDNFMSAGSGNNKKPEGCGAVGYYNFTVTETKDGKTRAGALQLRVTIAASPTLSDGDTVFCRYRISETRLLNGGQGWKVNDEFRVNIDFEYEDEDGNVRNDMHIDYVVTEVVKASGPVEEYNISAVPDTDDGSVFPLLEDLAQAIVDRTDLEDGNIEIIGNGLYVHADFPFKFDTSEGDLINILNNQALFNVNWEKDKKEDEDDPNADVKPDIQYQYPNPIAVVNNVANLPLECKQGFVCKVQNSFTEEDDYYVRFVRDYGDLVSEPTSDRIVESGMGYWMEVAKPGEVVILDANSLPRVLKFFPSDTEANRWLIFRPQYAQRMCGTAEQYTPSFVGSNISNIMFYRNRLVCLCDNSVVTSQAGDFTNFFPATALTVSPSDPVDIETSSDYYANLYAGIQINNALLLLGEYNQFLLTTDSDIFTPNTAKLSQISSYKFDTNSEPFMIGTNVGFLGNTETSTSMYEMTNIFREGQTDVIEKSKLVSNSLADGYSMVSSSRETGLITLGNKNSNTIWLYKYFKENSQNDIQQAWFKWTLPDKVFYQFLDNNKHYVVTKDGKLYRNDMDGAVYQDDGVDYEMKLSLPTFYVTKAEQQAYRADTTASLVIHRMYLNTGESNYYTINIDRYGKDPYVVDYEQSIQDAYLADAEPITIEREQSIPLYERNTNLDITITSNFNGPFTLYSLRWEGDFNPKYYKRV